MKRILTVLIAVPLLAVLVGGGFAFAQDQQYALKDYMPETVGSKWTMKAAGQQGDVTITYEVDKARDIGGQQATPIVTKDAQGNVRRGSLESVTDTNLTLFGMMFVPPNSPAGTAPTDSLYTPAAVFPGTLKAGQSAQAAVKSSRGGQPQDVTMKLELAAVESVTVPKGTFADCLKLVYTTTFGTNEMKRTVWYAKGVGMVKSERPGRNNQPPRVEELTDYQLAQ